MLVREYARERKTARQREETMSFIDDDRPAPKPKIAVDDDLNLLSLHELEERIAAFKAEIERNEEELERKRQSLSAADSVFKS
jgi:uncharacterized small protein (DUF1192 family)